MMGDNFNLIDPLGLRTGSVADPYDIWGEASQQVPPRRTPDLNARQQLLKTSGDVGGSILGFADNLVTPTAQKAQSGLVSGLSRVGSPAGLIPEKANVLRMAGSPRALAALKLGTGIGAVGGVLGAGDVVFGNDSAANKVMDATAMGIGGFLGMAGGPMGAAAGAGVGKAASDGLQWLFGDKKTAEQRQMQQALYSLNGGNY